MSIGSILGFESNLMGQRLDTWKKQPERLVLGINTPADTALWNGVTGKNYKPTMDMWGGPTNDQYQTAQNQGVDIRSGKQMNDIAHVIASMYAANGLSGGASGGGNGMGMGGSGGMGGMGGGGGIGGGGMGSMPGLSGMFGGGQKQNTPANTNQDIVSQQQKQQQAMIQNADLVNALRQY